MAPVADADVGAQLVGPGNRQVAPHGPRVLRRGFAAHAQRRHQDHVGLAGSAGDQIRKPEVGADQHQHAATVHVQLPEGLAGLDEGALVGVGAELLVAADELAIGVGGDPAVDAHGSALLVLGATDDGAADALGQAAHLGLVCGAVVSRVVVLGQHQDVLRVGDDALGVEARAHRGDVVSSR